MAHLRDIVYMYIAILLRKDNKVNTTLHGIVYTLDRQ